MTFAVTLLGRSDEKSRSVTCTERLSPFWLIRIRSADRTCTLCYLQRQLPIVPDFMPFVFIVPRIMPMWPFIMPEPRT